MTVLSGDLKAEDDILEWLVQNRNSGDEEDVIEEVEFNTLEAMVTAVENIAVLFCKQSFYDERNILYFHLDNAKSASMDNILENMETLDDDCDVHGVHFVKISDPAAAYHFGVSSLPSLVYFKNRLPSVFEGEQQ